MVLLRWWTKRDERLQPSFHFILVNGVIEMPKETSLDDDSAVVVEEPFALAFSITRRGSENAKEDIMEAFRKTIEVASHYQGVEKGVRQVIKALDRSVAQVCFLASDCDESSYVQLVEVAMCVLVHA